MFDVQRSMFKKFDNRHLFTLTPLHFMTTPHSTAKSKASTPTLGFRRRRRVRREMGKTAVHDYRVVCPTEPFTRWIELTGPGRGIRLVRAGYPDFHSFAELAKTLVHPGMTDLERALAVYRFSNRFAYGFSAGWGGTEMTRFLNGFGYSFCWGQADFQHLLYEAAGLRVRTPGLKGHSSVEVLIEGKWRMLDAFMRLLAPSPELDGLATGAELASRPDLFAAICEGGLLANARDYWSWHIAQDTYEPWQDSHAMRLDLRRGESLRLYSAKRGPWCLAPREPSDYVTAAWRYRPPLDATFLSSELTLAEHAVAKEGAIRCATPGQTARLECRIRHPYPVTAGQLALGFRGRAGRCYVLVSADARLTWQTAYDGPTGDLGICLDRWANPRHIADAGHNVRPDEDRREHLIRIEWNGAAALQRLELDLLAQAHRPSIPPLVAGSTAWRLIGSESGIGVTHVWDEYPDLTVSNPSPIEGDTIELAAVVHNRGARPVRRARVRFVRESDGAVLGAVTLPSIPARGRTVARIRWQAGLKENGPPRPYRQTVIRAEVGSEAETGAWSGVARATVLVRPRPVPRFSDTLVWSSDGRHAHERRLILRAALVHQLQPRDRILYQLDVPLAATLTPYLGKPGRGGVRLTPPQRLENIRPSEFAVAEWTLATDALPRAFDAWVEVVCDAPVAAAHRRLLARRRVRLDADDG